MDRQVSVKKEKNSDYLIPVAILCILITFVRFHHVNSRHEINEEITELAELLAEPLWNYDTKTIDEFCLLLSLEMNT